ncbi:MAG: hypothetical protein AAGN66_04535 [Acidobacteriota bacterium]
MTPGNRRRPAAAVSLLWGFLTAAAAVADGPGPVTVQIEAPERPDLVEVRVEDLPAALVRSAFEENDWGRLLWVGAVDPEAEGFGSTTSGTGTFGTPDLEAAVASTTSDRQPLLGRYRVEGDLLVFRPRFPVAPGLVVVARVDGHRLRRAPARLTASYRVPEPERSPSTRVEAVYPTVDTVPSNLLRLYVHFSAPMAARGVLDHVRLVDGDGEPVPLAFVEVGEGLWDPGRTRLTLFVHPGRVKRGVGPNVAMGPVLREGEEVRLVIDAGALDAFGVPLAAGFERRYRVGPADRRSPDPGAWGLVAPAGGRDPLEVRLDAPADRALLERLPAVLDAGGQPVAGSVEIADGERTWRFVPDVPWRPGPHVLEVPAALEDPSGNRVDGLFEAEPGQPRGDTGPRRLDFEIPQPP